jgi:hypothetical protein
MKPLCTKSKPTVKTLNRECVEEFLESKKRSRARLKTFTRRELT